MPARRYFTGWHRSTWLLVLESGVTRGKRITSPMYHPLNVRLILCAGGQRVGLLFFSSWPASVVVDEQSWLSSGVEKSPY